jgi:hypothetical protein
MSPIVPTSFCPVFKLPKNICANADWRTRRGPGGPGARRICLYVRLDSIADWVAKSEIDNIEFDS